MNNDSIKLLGMIGFLMGILNFFPNVFFVVSAVLVLIFLGLLGLAESVPAKM